MTRGATREAFGGGRARRVQDLHGRQAFNADARGSAGETVALLDDLLCPPTVAAAVSSQATATWRLDVLRWD